MSLPSVVSKARKLWRNRLRFPVSRREVLTFPLRNVLSFNAHDHVPLIPATKNIFRFHLPLRCPLARSSAAICSGARSLIAESSSCHRQPWYFLRIPYRPRYRRYPSLSILLTYSSCTKFESVEENLLNESVAPHSFPGAAVRRDDHQFCVLQRRRHQRNRNHLLPNWAAVLWVCVCQPIFLSVGRRKRHLCICHVVGRSRTLSNC